MTHLELMIEWFKAHNGFATLGEILHSGQPWSHEFNARKTDLKKRTPYLLVLDRGSRPTENLYRLIKHEESGQIRFVA
jgi:hypothetical protein